MDPNSERFRAIRGGMDEAERAKFDAYVSGLPEGADVFWRCRGAPKNGHWVIGSAGLRYVAREGIAIGNVVAPDT